MPENADAWDLWRAAQTQWRAGGMGVVGLDYAEVRRWARDLGLAMTPALWGKIWALERATLKAQHAKGADDAAGSQSHRA
jgi:hypothetical protein